MNKRWGVIFKSIFILSLMVMIWLPKIAFTAQDSKGRDFWVTFMENYTGGPNLQLFITSEFNTQGMVEIPGLAWSQNFSITANQTTTINIPSSAMLIGTGIHNKAIHIIADDEISVYGLSQLTWTTDAYLSLPVDTSNFEYFVMAYDPLAPWGSEFAVVANHDNTTLSYWLPNQGSQTVLLDQGEVYFYNNSNLDVTGTYIESDKPVSVFGGHQCVNIPPGYAYCDHIVEQIPALSTWGKKFYSVPLATRNYGDTFRILASMDSTEVRINGIFVTTLNAGEFHELIINELSIIETSQPSLVAQYSNGTTFDGVTSDPFMMIVPPIEQALNHYTFSTPGTVFNINYVNILAPNSIVNDITLDGSLLNPSLFTPVPGTNFYGAQIPVSVGSHTIYAPENFGIHSYGFASYDSYGYPGGMSFEVINPGAITLSPTAIDFGTFSIFDITNIYKERTITLINKSNYSVTIDEISLVGQDFSDYEIVSINGIFVFNTIYNIPFKLWPYGSLEIKVAISPVNTPIDAIFDASLSVIGHDEDGYTAKSVSALTANLSSSTLIVDVLDASPTITTIDDSGKAFDNNENEVTENTVAELDAEGDLKRVGLVADGNARLFLRAQTNATYGYVTFNIKQPSKSEALLYDLSFQSNDDNDGFYTLQVPVTQVDSNIGQATAILRAAERFKGGELEEVNVDIETCYQETDTGPCMEIEPVRIREQRAPVVLMHGLWANTDSWRNNWLVDEGMEVSLENNHFRVRAYNYPGFNDPDDDAQKNLNIGPSVTMANTVKSLADFIKNGSSGLCDQYRNGQNKTEFACTRADIVAHSMGGLAGRKFILDNKYYKNKFNFNLGAVRRIVTLSTPHFGSQLANLLRYDNSSINNCIEDEDPTTQNIIENENIEEGIRNLSVAKLYVLSAIDDLRVDSNFLSKLNGSIQKIPIFALYGDTGTEIDLRKGNLLFIKRNIRQAGCTHEDIFGVNMHSDGVVPVNSSSASEKINSEFTQSLPGIYHVGMGLNETAINATIPLLTIELSKFSDEI
ncbi:alpha/beta fold hydrolase [Thermodesulfobacteriota bacterium]